MEVFVRGVPASSTQPEFEKFFSAPIEALGIRCFIAQKSRHKTFGTLTFSNPAFARKFLDVHGSRSLGRNRWSEATKPLRFHRGLVTCTESNKKPSDFAVRSLVNREDGTLHDDHERTEIPGDSSTKLCCISRLSCGFWTYGERSSQFVPAYDDRGSGHILLGPGTITIAMDSKITLEMEHVSVECVWACPGAGTNDPSTIIFSLYYAPSFIQVTESTNGCEDDLSQSFARMRLQNPNTVPRRRRVNSVGPTHNLTTGHCFVYRLELLNSIELDRLVAALRRKPSIPSVDSYEDFVTSLHDFDREMKGFLDQLRMRGPFGSMPFAVKFQCHKLAAYSYLRPRAVSQLLSFIRDLLGQTREYAVVDALRTLMRALPSPGPATAADELNVDSIKQTIGRLANQFVYSGSDFEHARRHKMSIGLIHRVYVTPAGVYPTSLMLETKNPIIRKYSGKSDRFIRVTFADEDFERLSYDREVDRSGIFAYFRKVMNDGLFIGGDYFQFLGFSNSSLRESQCWFMSMFKDDNGLALNPLNIINDLGDFSHIRSPAKCAARIGQAFSDTTHSIELQPQDIANIPDIERNGRVFSDGIGTISASILNDVWRVFSRTRKDRATVLQIRFQGAKGVLALDSRLKGRQICLRDSMIKFTGSNNHNLGICGAAFSPLPMYLNRSYIQVLEDLGVPAQHFLDLQSLALKDLQGVRASPTDASNFLEKNHFGTAAQVPQLIDLLNDIGLDFRRDTFLKDIVDLAATTQLRDMKYRSRIPVPDAHTLFGVVDETGQLSENQVYVPIRDKNGSRHVLTGRALVTRSPALHPGDIQQVDCVDLPETSSLVNLHNCIVFSQHGQRDLPSMLSGGDLDGDLFSVIFNQKLWPCQIHEPASYPRPTPIDIERRVESKDIIDFFVKFMETDQIGHISTIHTVLADQRPKGTRDKDCLKLAEMASTAVDYAKTGIPVNMAEFPYSPDLRFRPDFMAEAPHLVMNAETTFEGLQAASFLGLMYNARNRGKDYYKSDRALGKLYRGIDERKFLEEVHESGEAHDRISARQGSILKETWRYVQSEALLIEWTQHRTTALEIKRVYEEEIRDTAYQFSTHHRQPLSEKEVFAGIILGRGGGKLDRRVREKITDMREQIDRQIRYIVDWITYGDAVAQDSEDEENFEGSQFQPSASEEALPRSIACLHVALNEQGLWDKDIGEIKSFKYVAAVVCLKNLKEYFGQARGSSRNRRG